MRGRGGGQQRGRKAVLHAIQGADGCTEISGSQLFTALSCTCGPGPPSKKNFSVAHTLQLGHVYIPLRDGGSTITSSCPIDHARRCIKGPGRLSKSLKLPMAVVVSCWWFEQRYALDGKKRDCGPGRSMQEGTWVCALIAAPPPPSALRRVAAWFGSRREATPLASCSAVSSRKGSHRSGVGGAEVAVLLGGGVAAFTLDGAPLSWGVVWTLKREGRGNHVVGRHHDASTWDPLASPEVLTKGGVVVLIEMKKKRMSYTM